jgi:predicted nuclease with TOPRIM domain
MAAPQRDLLSMLADRGEEAIQRLAEAPGADRLLGVAQSMRERLDEMQKRMRGIDQLERRVAELERKVESLSAPSASSPTKKTTPRKPSTTSAKKKPAASTAKRGSSSRTGSGSPG